MTGKTHRMGGVLAGVIFSSIFFTKDIPKHGLEIVSVISGSVLGSLFLYVY